ncbi:MAG: GAP family protein [Thermoleophilia bacterium]
MEKSLLEILPLALAATISPSGLLFVTMILSGKDHPKKNSVLFLCGAVLLLVVLGSAISLTYKSAVATAGHPDNTAGILDIVMGILIIVFIGKTVIFGKKDRPARKKKQHRPYLIMGFLYMIINASSLIPYIAASKMIAENEIGLGNTIVVFTALILITMFMISFPVMITILLPEKSERVMAPVKSFMARYGNQIAQGYFFLIAIYLIVHGIRGMQAG